MAFEESPNQIIRNMKSIGLKLEPFIKKGLLKFHSSHPTENGLEMHLVKIHTLVKTFKPKVVIIDPITNLISVGMEREVKSMLMRLIDMLQADGITILFTALTMSYTINDQADESISSLVDSWILVRDVELNGERNRALYIMKSRGMKHSNQVREFLITNKGLELVDVFLGPNGIMIGSEREAQKLLQLSDKEISENQKRHGLAYNRQYGITQKSNIKKRDK